MTMHLQIDQELKLLILLLSAKIEILTLKIEKLK